MHVKSQSGTHNRIILVCVPDSTLRSMSPPAHDRACVGVLGKWIHIGEGVKVGEPTLRIHVRTSVGFK